MFWNEEVDYVLIEVNMQHLHHLLFESIIFKWMNLCFGLVVDFFI